MAHTILRLPCVNKRTGDSRSTLYLRISQGLFTRPVKLGPRASGWPDYEVDAIVAARIAGKSDTEIRALVSALEAARKQALDPFLGVDKCADSESDTETEAVSRGSNFQREGQSRPWRGR